MKEILGYCGYRCDLCPAYRENLKTPEDRQRVSEAWERYYDYKIDPEKVPCDGCIGACQAPNPNCKVRPCAIGKGVSTCAECDEFICGRLKKQIEAIKPIAEKHGRTMPPEDYQRYIHPYESEERLRRRRDQVGA